MKQTLFNFTLQCLKVSRSCKEMIKDLSLPCKGTNHVFKSTRGNKDHHNLLDSMAQNIILGALLLVKFSEAFQMSEGFQQEALMFFF